MLDIADDELYRLTDTPEDEVLHDVADGRRWPHPGRMDHDVDIGDYDVYAFTFERRPPPDDCEPQTPPRRAPILRAALSSPSSR